MNRNSRLLQLVVAGVLLSQGGTTAATTYDDDTVTVPGSYWGGTSTTFDYYPEPPDEAYDYDVYDFSGDGYDSGGGDTTDSNEVDQAVCDAIAAEAPEGCDPLHPPQFVANGCGGGMFTGLVPDYLLVNGTPVTRLGPIFADSCNRHDHCYAIYPGDKDQCDAKLGYDMVERARRLLSDLQWRYYERHVRFQAALYNTALQTQPTLTLANYFFNTAQAEGKCRNVATQLTDAGCND